MAKSPDGTTVVSMIGCWVLGVESLVLSVECGRGYPVEVSVDGASCKPLPTARLHAAEVIYIYIYIYI